MKKTLLWISAFVITITAAIYQRHTGPTYPRETKIILNGKEYKLKLVRSLSLDEASEVKLNISDPSIKARIFYKRFKTNDEYTASDFTFRSNDGKDIFYAEVPKQPAAGKIQYYIEITDSTATKTLFREEPVIIRFKGGVPALILVPHIILMFLAMLFSNLAGIMALVKYPKYKKYGVITLILLLIGGLILGPLVQYYAFGELWTGIPFGWDLTDNKVLIAVIFWIFAVIMNRKEDRPYYTALAAFVLLLVYSIPHSLFGSELDYASGEVIQG
ncbi:MAG TPA: hypothetical protein VHO46_06495 [Bacteroidales bacterium]|nr:hypothetical protein [Bacteroidales bacterium]